MSLPGIEGVRILAVGAEVRLPEATYRVLRPDAMDELDEARRPLERLAVAHGAAAFELPPRWTDADPRPGVLLRVRGAWTILELGESVLGMATAAPIEPGTSWRLVALLADEMQEEGDPTCVVRHVREDPSSAGSWEGDRFRLRPHPLLVDRPLRDWAWIWGRSTWGPVLLTLRLGRNADEIASFVAGCAPLPYARVASDRYRVSASDPTAPFRELRFFDGGLTLVRDHHHPSDELVAFDGGLLAALASGALGELTWDVIDGDYLAYLATGHTMKSLADYLDPAVDADRQAARWREVFAVRYVDAGSATTPAEVVGLLSTFLGATAAVADAEFDAWLAARPIETLPRRLEVTLSAAFDSLHGSQWFFDRVLAVQPRVSWSIRRA